MIIKDLGISDYESTREMQIEFREKLIESNLASDEKILLVEHNPVYTLGKHGKAENMLLSEDALNNLGAKCIRIERGGDITFHGPGQLVIYPIINLKNHKLGVKEYIYRLEQAVIDTISNWGIRGERIDGATGVWIKTNKGSYRKICAIGVSISHFCTMHGLALNVNTDLRYFNSINPCGFTSNSVTSMALETNKVVDMKLVKTIMNNNLVKSLS